MLQVWRRSEAGEFRQVFAGDAPTYSERRGAWLVVTDGGTRLRVADDEVGEQRWLTGEESERARAAAAEAEVAGLQALLGG